MKLCPECRRDYYDDSLSYCLDDGSLLLDGPAAGTESQTAILSQASAPETDAKISPARPLSTGQSQTIQQTAILPTGGSENGPSTKGFDKRVVIAIAGLALIVSSGFLAYKHFAPAKQIESIAVMPFVNESGNLDNEYLSDGMTESLIGSLSQIPKLNVKARSSVFRYKGTDINLQKIARELNVQAILTGRIVQRGEQLILNLELVDTQTENALWSEQYTRRQADLITLQSDIARDVANKLRTKLSGQEQNQIAKNFTTNREAYQLYLRGRFELKKKTEDSFSKGISFFQQAIEQDPNYALAYAGLADAYSQMGSWTTLAPSESFPKAKNSAEKALQLDDTLAEAHASLAFVKFYYEWDFAGADREFKHAISLDPSYAPARELYGYQMYLTDPRRFDSAIGELNTAHELDPLSLSTNFGIATLFYFERNFDESIRRIKEMQSLDPNFTLGYGLLGTIYIQKNMNDEAVAALLKGTSLEGGGLSEKQIYELRQKYNEAGIKGYLRRHAEFLQERARDRYVSPIFIAMDYTLSGEKDLAFVWLEKAYSDRSSWLTEIGVDPVWDNLRDDKRFQDLLRRVGLPH
jgi:TolB-like protein